MGWFIKEINLNDTIGPCLKITNKDSNNYDILLIGHMDTVFPKGTVEKRPFSIKEKKAYGPGVNDMKAGLLSMYYALKALEYEEKTKDISICVALNSDEEISSKYSRPWLEELSLKSKYVLVLEPARANGALVKERKGVGRYTIEFFGIAAHSGVDHEKGRSAINELGHWIVKLHNLTNYDLGTTVNVGVVSGGISANSIADYAQAKIDLRIKDIKEGEKFERILENLAKTPVTPEVKVKVSGGITRPPMNATEKTEKLCKIVEKIGEEVGINIIWASTGGGSDANFAAHLGIPSLDGLGPVGGGSHGPNEYIEIDSIEPRFKLLKELLIQLPEQIGS